MAAKKAKTRQHTPIVRPTREQARWPHIAMWVLAGLGIGLSLFLTYHHYSASGGGGLYARFCGGQGSYINCNAVLSSPYAYLFGLPLVLWAASTYLAVLGFLLMRWVGVLALLTAFALGFSLYLAGISLLVIRALCLFCTTLYVINMGLFLCALYLLWQAKRVVVSQFAYGATGVLVAVALLGGWQMADERSAVATSSPGSLGRETGRGGAEFTQWYDARPTVAAGGEERHVEGKSGAAVTVIEFIDFR